MLTISLRDDAATGTSSRCGRVSAAALSPYYQMMRVITNLQKNKKVEEWEKEPNVCLWSGIKCEKDKVSSVFWQNSELAGELALQHLPISTERVNFSFNKLDRLDGLNNLPSEITEFVSANNPLVGTIDLKCMPEKMRHYVISETELDGNLDLTSLPSTIVFISLRENNFSGEINLSRLPDSLKTLWLQGNRLSGVVNVNNVSECSIDIRKNAFDGTIPDPPPVWLKYEPQRHSNK